MGLDRQVLSIASVVVLGAIMSILDTTIVNVALDTLGREFDAPLSSVQWVSTAYLLALASVIPLTGWAGARFGEKQVWMVCTALFVGGSVLSGLAWSLGSLICFRTLQGVGGGLVMPIGMAILARSAGPGRMGRVMSIVGVPMLLGPILGPVLGGLIVTQLDWRWIFYVNVPIGAVALVLAARLLPRSEVTGASEPLDWRGLALLSPGLALAVFGLSEAGSHGLGAAMLAPTVVGVLLVAAFVVHAVRRGPAALVDLSYFRKRGFAMAVSVSFFCSFSIFGVMILLPLYYQLVRGDSALTAGLLMAPQGIGAAIAVAVSGPIVDRVGPRRVIPFGIGVACIGTVAYTRVGPDSSYALLAVALFVRGVGFGASAMPSVAAAYQALEREAIGHATTAVNIVQRVGGSLGVAVMAVVLERRVHAELPTTAAEHGLSAVHAIPAREREQALPLLGHAFSQTFLVSLVLLVVGLAPALLLPRRARPHAEPALEP